MEPYRINYVHILEPIKEIPIAICNRIDGEKMQELEKIHFALPVITKWSVRVAMRTFEGAKYLAGEDEKDPARRLRTAVCIQPLARSILDHLFTLTFLYDRPVENARWYLASGWADARRTYDAMLERHGTDPEWREYLPNYCAMVNSMAVDARIAPEEMQDPKSVGNWPSPGHMTHGQAKGGGNVTQDHDRRAFLRHLRRWYYGQLSADAHFCGLGFMNQGTLSYLAEAPDETMQEVMISQKFFAILTIYVALLSEVVGQLRFPHEAVRLRDVWNHIKQWPDAADLFEQRYNSWLPGKPIVPEGNAG